MASATVHQPVALVAAVGDLMLGDSPLVAGYGLRSRYPGESVREALLGFSTVLAGADIGFGNLETQLTRNGLGRTRLERDIMRGDPEFANVLRTVGFNVLAVANNHAMQHGASAFSETASVLREAGIQVAGLRGESPWTAHPVRLVTHSGVAVGILAYSLRPRQYGAGEPAYAAGSELQILGDVERLKRQVDYVVGSLHWGEEFVGTPSANEVRFARQLVEAGVSLLIGHHPHVVRPVMLHASGCIAFSLGNAISDMIWLPEFTHGVGLRARLGEGRVSAETVGITTDRRYRVHCRPNGGQPVSAGAVDALDEDEYQRAVTESIRRYRRAAFRHVVANSWRSPLPLTAGVVTTKVGNWWNRLRRRSE